MFLALPLPLVDHVGGSESLLVLAGEVVVLVAVVVAAHAAVLTLDGRGGHDLDEVAVEGHPDFKEGVHVVGGAPSEDPRNKILQYVI